VRQELILAVPPVAAADSKRVSLSKHHFDRLSKRVDGFSLMTYDYTAGGAPGPNAPLPWMEKNLKELLAVEDFDDEYGAEER
jgi:chitinase domain-containing protein 1